LSQTRDAAALIPPIGAAFGGEGVASPAES